jgi:hypothetical protein
MKCTASLAAVLILVAAVIASCSDDSSNQLQVSEPVIALNHGLTSVDIRISSATEGAAIYYGIDDRTVPNSYSGKFTLTDRTPHRIYAVARKDG